MESEHKFDSLADNGLIELQQQQPNYQEQVDPDPQRENAMPELQRSEDIKSVKRKLPLLWAMNCFNIYIIYDSNTSKDVTDHSPDNREWLGQKDEEVK